MSPLDLELLVLGLGAAQFLFTLLFLLKLNRKSPPSGAPHAPPVSVIVPCRDDAAGLPEGVGALLAQDYEGRREFIFVVADAADPAFGRLKGLLAEQPGAHARLEVSQVKPARCAAKLANLLGALPHVAAESEVLVFADSDLIVPADWLRNMVGPLRDPCVGAASSAMIYLPCGGLWGFLRSMWVAAGVVYCAVLDRATGQSLALRRRDFDDWGVARVWEASLLEDMPVTALVRGRGLRVAFVPAAMPHSAEACGGRAFFSVFNRWIVCFRVYDPLIWVLGLLVTMMKWWIVLRGAWLGTLVPALCLYAADAANLALVFAVLDARFPIRFAALPARLRWHPVLAAAAAPLLWGAYAVNFLNSLVSSTVLWAGLRYRVRGPRDVEVLPS